MLLRIFLSISSFIITRSASAPAPAPQGVTDPCNSITTYSDLQESAVWLGNWSMTGASAVTSNSEPANLEATYSESVGITITVGVELGADLYRHLRPGLRIYADNILLSDLTRWLRPASAHRSLGANLTLMVGPQGKPSLYPAHHHHPVWYQ